MLSLTFALAIVFLVQVALVLLLVLAYAVLVIVRLLRAKRPAVGSVVVVTGGSRGLGLAIASRFAGTPAHPNRIRLVLASRKLEELQQAQQTLLTRHGHLTPADFYLVAADLSRTEECHRLIAETVAHFGHIDILVNNAGIIEIGPVEAQTAETFEHTMRVNFFAGFHATWAALPHMRSQPLGPARRRGAIVNIASIGGKLAAPHMLPYSAAKFAVVGFSEGLHAELRGKNIVVTTVCPGLMRSGGENHAHFTGDESAEKKWFMLAAKTPGLSVTIEHAADVIYRAVAQRRAEVTISPQAWLGARFAGLFPETLQWMNGLVNEHILPKAPATTETTPP